jgi:hypothetical protein
MSFAIRPPATRQLTILLASLILAASAAFAVSADTNAAKPVPMVNGTTATCHEVLDEARYSGSFTLSANKGKWVFVVVEFKLGDAEYTEILSGRVETIDQAFEMTGDLPSQATSWRLSFTDRNGEPVGTETVANASACSVAP